MSLVYLPSTPIQWNWVSLTGPDVRDFLHRVTSADVRNLEEGSGTRGCFLNPQGRIRAYFTLWNYGPEDFAFEFDSGVSGKWKKELFAAIDQYTFAEKMTLTDLTPLSAEPKLECRWIFGENLDIPALGTRAIEDEIRLCHQGSLDFGRPWITAWGRGPRLNQWLERRLPDHIRVGPEHLDAWRIEAVRPWIDLEITDATSPLEVGLVDAVANQKGCYPGQEVIEKVISLGAPARRLGLIELEAPASENLRSGSKLFNLADAPIEVGEITSVTRSASTFRALAIIRKIHAKEGLEVKLEDNARGKLARIAPYA